MSSRSFSTILAMLLLLTSCKGEGLSGLTSTDPAFSPNPKASTPGKPFITSGGSPIETYATPTTASFTQVPKSLIARPLYTLNAILRYSTHSLAVDETIFFQNDTGEILTDLVLAVEPNLWAGCFVLGGLLVNGQDTGKLSLIGDRLLIPLAKPLVPGGLLTLSLQFDLHLPAADIYHVFGFNTHQENLVDWYPFIVPYSNGWILRPPANVGEHLTYEVADFDITITQQNPSTLVVLAASAPEEKIAGVSHYILKNARTFVFSASPSYQTISITTADVKISSYYFRGNEAPSGAVLDAATRAINTFSDMFGAYPYSSLSIVESPFFDGMEYDGLFFLSQDYYKTYDGKLLSNLVDLAVHETAHQWWFGQVGNDQAMEPWLDEALATYSEELFYEKNIPQISAWWVFRVESFSPSGWVNTDIYDGINFRTYANAVYLRGAQFLEALRKIIGDDAFFAFLKDYSATMSGKIATAEDFFRILGTHSSANISDLISSYFQHSN